MVLVMCANAGIDRTYEVENFALGAYHTPRRFRADAGGKGVNVARSLRALGLEVALVGFAGGMSRQFIAGRLARQNIVTDLVPIGEDSRLCINIVDPVHKSQTRVDEVSPLVTPDEVARLKRQWWRLLERVELAIISGSAPRGVPFHFYAEMVFLAKQKQVRVILDARDQLLEAAIEAAPDVIKPNLAELERLIGSSLSVPEGVVEAGRALISRGIRTVIVSLGNRGAIFLTPDQGEYWAAPPEVEFVSSVGCGDAMVAGLAAATVRREPLEQRMRWAVAAGASAASTFGAALELKEDVEKLLPGVVVERLDQGTALPPADG